MQLYKDKEKFLMLGIAWCVVSILVTPARLSSDSLTGEDFRFPYVMEVNRTVHDVLSIGSNEEDEIEVSGAIVELESSDTSSVDLVPMESLEDSGAITELSSIKGYTAQEIDALEHVVMAEAESESLEGKIAIVNVVMNRVDMYGTSIEETIFSPNQFCTSERFELEPNEECKEAVKLALVNNVKSVDDDVVFFCADWMEFEKYTEVDHIGGHRFYTW